MAHLDSVLERGTRLDALVLITSFFVLGVAGDSSARCGVCSAVQWLKSLATLYLLNVPMMNVGSASLRKKSEGARF